VGLAVEWARGIYPDCCAPRRRRMTCRCS
jgi:hypothetical protein